MEVLFRDFQHANEEGSGPLLAATISPIAPPNYLNRLETIWKSTIYVSAERDIGSGLIKSSPGPIKYPNQEINIWSDIYLAYWKSIGEILVAQEKPNGADWSNVYEAWKELANAVIRGYSSGALEAWTLPVLYMAGKHLRIFAIKADESAKKSENGVDVDMGGMQDDIAGDYGKNVKLEDAARVINRMFTLCISDRYVVPNPKVFLKPPLFDIFADLNLFIKSLFGRVKEMGPLLYNEPPIQDLLQAQLRRPLQEHPSRSLGVKDRYARPGILSQIPHCHIQVLRWCHTIPRGRLCEC